MPIPEDQVELLLAIARDATLGTTLRERMEAIAPSLQALIPYDSLVVAPSPTDVIDIQAENERGYCTPDLVERMAESGATYQAYQHADPKGHLMGTTGVNVSTGRLVDDADFGKDAYTGEFLPVQGIRYELGRGERLFPGVVALIGIHRGARRSEFSDGELRLFRHVAADIVRAARGAVFRAHLAQRGAAALAGAGDAGLATLVLGPGLELRFADPAAFGLLERVEQPERVGGAARDLPLPDRLLEDARLLASAPREGAFVERLLPLRDGGWLVVRGGLVEHPSGPEVVFSFRPVEPGSAVRFEAEVARAGLTPRERQVALHAVRGLSNGEIARRLAVSQSTVALHLNNTYRKLRVSGRTDLPLRLLGLDLPEA